MATPEQVLEAIHKVEHPEIAMTLVDLGMVRDIQIEEQEQKVTLTLVLPFLGIPEAVRNYMINSLYQAIKEQGYELAKVYIAQMTEEERQAFFEKEHKHWRG